jgi:hypothetical protein
VRPLRQGPPRIDASARPADAIAGTDADFSVKEEVWEEAVFRNFEYFTVWRPGGAPKEFYRDFAEACLAAYRDRRALVYAIAKSGRQFCVVRTRWAHFLTIWKEMIR